MRLDRRELAAIFAGGFVGTVARAWIADAWAHDPASWPWATFAVNVAGAALVGWLATRFAERLPPSAYRLPLLGAGLCGALTTFSTMQLELLTMLDAGHWGLALGYVTASVAAGLVAVAVATSLARRAGGGTGGSRAAAVPARLDGDAAA